MFKTSSFFIYILKVIKYIMGMLVLKVFLNVLKQVSSNLNKTISQTNIQLKCFRKMFDECCMNNVSVLMF